MMTLLWLLFIGLLISCSVLVESTHCTDDTRLYVHPDGDNTSCPQLSVEGQRYECHTLTFYIENKEDYFTSSSIFCFLNGVFLHETNVTVENVTDLKFIGTTIRNSTIDCSGSDNAGFAFKNTVRLSIENLIIVNCGQRVDFGYGRAQSALACFNGSDHNISNVQFLHSLNQNIYYSSVQGVISIQRSTFANATSSNRSYYSGNSFFFTNCRNTMATKLHIEHSEFLNNNNEWKGYDDHFENFASGLLIVLKCTNVQVSINHVTLDGNKAFSGGNLAIVFRNISHVFTSPVLIQNSHIINGTGQYGGGIYAMFVEASLKVNNTCQVNDLTIPRTLLSIENTTIAGNVANTSGGGLYLKQKESQTYCRLAKIVIKNSNFRNNTLGSNGHGGLALHSLMYVAYQYLQHAKPQFLLQIIDTNFSKHLSPSKTEKGVIYTDACPHVNLTNVLIHENECSGILGIGSIFIFSGSISIHSNNGSSGGGILFCSDSVMFLSPHTNVTIANNHAEHAGGGICIDIQCLQTSPMCFFQFIHQGSTLSTELLKTIHVSLVNNTAEYAGNGIYGGSVNSCYFLDSPSHDEAHEQHYYRRSLAHFNEVFRIAPDGPSNITSPPESVCLCNQTPKCNQSYYEKHVYPGEKFNLSLVVVGQLNGAVPGIIVASLKNRTHKKHHLKKSERVQKTEGIGCNILAYTLYTELKQEILDLDVQIFGENSFVERLSYFKTLSINITFKTCPIGFTLHRTSHRHERYACDCNSIMKLPHVDISCNINDKKLTRTKQFWIGYNNSTKTYLVSAGFAFDYCSPKDTVTINVGNDFMMEDIQCNFNRTGILCGACRENYSVILGSSSCRNDCSYNYLLLLLAFGLAGILLVFLITILNLTVAEGTISGLLFFVNIVQVNSACFFQYHHIPVLTTSLLLFLSWVNLDLGIPVCFYQGMDDYGKAWLQFVFPIYIWLISVSVVLLSRRFNSFSRLFGTNGVKVLATLVLLSYSKMLRAIISTLHFQIIYHYGNGSVNESHTVHHWKPDANLVYLQGKHIPLFIFGVLCLVICLPFTMTLFCIQNLNRLSNRVCFRWVWQLKPFFDAYTGPFSKRARFWTGLLLLTRIVIFIISATQHSNIEKTSIYATVLACTLLIVIKGSLWKQGIYEKRALDVLECSFLLNLSVLCIGTTYTNYDEVHKQWWQSILAHISVFIAFISFVGIILYHGYKKIIKNTLNSRADNAAMGSSGITPATQRKLHLASPLNNFPPFVRFDQDREPLLASDNSELSSS